MPSSEAGENAASASRAKAARRAGAAPFTLPVPIQFLPRRRELGRHQHARDGQRSRRVVGRPILRPSYRGHAPAHL
jgi:hypothetical protein